MSRGVARLITPRFKAIINRELLRAVDDRARRHPTTLYADIHCLVQILRRFNFRADAARAYTVPQLVDVLDCVYDFQTWWDAADLRRVGPHVEVESLLRNLRMSVPVHDNRENFLPDDYTAELFVAVIFCASLLCCTQGDDLALCRRVLNALRMAMGHPLPVVHLDPDLDFNPRARPLALQCEPSSRVAGLYARYFGRYPPLVQVGFPVNMAFNQFNNLNAWPAQPPPARAG